MFHRSSRLSPPSSTVWCFTSMMPVTLISTRRCCVATVSSKRGMASVPCARRSAITAHSRRPMAGSGASSSSRARLRSSTTVCSLDRMSESADGSIEAPAAYLFGGTRCSRLFRAQLKGRPLSSRPEVRGWWPRSLLEGLVAVADRPFRHLELETLQVGVHFPLHHPHHRICVKFSRVGGSAFAAHDIVREIDRQKVRFFLVAARG